ncbi:hypothetical protein D8674_029644 [Pyrus ussuriensis x Pyrus communis]|uniref:Uncharacterized protein n=1 Tax=Pyrus ussuriensis x Pyrus communis TaxID=2448454 RepID=A0A5N5I2M9_9ROSA|nr:hypothetical protein D8674_029644 [Pyrus ussuriensis x Pyrus communis]
MWSSLNLLGTTLDVSTGEWIVYSPGIGAGRSWYIEMGESVLNSLNLYTKVEGGFASIRDVTTMQLEELSKYLFLLFDDSFLAEQNYIFTTEVHPLPMLSNRKASVMCVQVCPTTMNSWECGGEQVVSACHVPDDCSDHRCLTDDECGIDSTNCRRRWCSMAGYCGLWLFI